MDTLLKAYLEKILFTVGSGLCAGAAVLVFLRWAGVTLPAWLHDVATYSGRWGGRVLPLAVTCALLFAGGMLWYRTAPWLPPARSLENIIIEEQLQRSKTIERADMIIIGDSSALMGVDAGLLGRLLGGRSVENLATLGWVGPRGYAHLLEQYSKRGQRVGAVVLLMHGVSLDRPEKDWDAYEERVISERDPGVAAATLASGFRAKLGAGMFGRLFALPMPAAWGGYYGTYFEVQDALRHNSGSIYEPIWVLPAAPESTRRVWAFPTGYAVHYTLSPAAERGLHDWALAAAATHAPHVFFGITPTVISYRTMEAIAENRHVAQKVEDILREQLGSRFAGLSLTPFIADGYFATNAAHLNILGREKFTRELAAKLIPQLGSRE